MKGAQCANVDARANDFVSCKGWCLVEDCPLDQARLADTGHADERNGAVARLGTEFVPQVLDLPGAPDDTLATQNAAGVGEWVFRAWVQGSLRCWPIGQQPFSKEADADLVAVLLSLHYFATIEILEDLMKFGRRAGKGAF